MFVSINTIDAILKTLPIGYYCGKQVPVSLDADAPTSYYSPMENKIVISYPIIAKGLEAVMDESYTETAVRSMLYHEISHVILTPNDLLKMAYNEQQRTAFNIFEDERIETLLGDYYLDTDFKQQLRNICQLDPAATDPIQRFFNIVRFRYGKAGYIEEVKRIINKYNNISASTDYEKIWNYVSDIRTLFKKIAGDPDACKVETPPQSKSGEGEKGDKADKKTATTGFDDVIKNDEAEKTEEIEASEGEAEEVESGEENTTCEALGRAIVREIAKQALSADKMLNDNAKQQLAGAENIIERLISNFNKKNSNGSGFNAYSGVFNPRAVVRDDYKYFERSAVTNGNTKYGTCRLNLFLDRSGSFMNNEGIVNALLAFLSEVERKNPNFSLSVSFINYEFVTCQSVKERQMHCTGGNDLPKNLTEIFNNLQKKDSYNYNIFLFDGDALSDNSDSVETCSTLFKQLDQPHTCVITDNDNKKYMRDDYKFTKAKVIVTSQYTEKLIENITKAFHIMFS